MAFRSISNDYNITTEGELAAILQNFDPDMIFNVLETNMNYKYREYTYDLTNLVTSYDYSFQQLTKTYGQDKNILNIRDKTYYLIIERILKFHNLELTDSEVNFDMYSLASIMYELFISSFTTCISNFFTTYIIREKESLYNMLMTMEEDKKLKNNSITYSKKLYDTDIKLAALHAYIPKIVESMCNFNITLHEFISTVYKYEPEKAKFLNSVLQDNEYFYADYVVPFVREHFVNIITSIRLSIQTTLPSAASLNIPHQQE